MLRENIDFINCGTDPQHLSHFSPKLMCALNNGCKMSASVSFIITSFEKNHEEKNKARKASGFSTKIGRKQLHKTLNKINFNEKIIKKACLFKLSFKTRKENSQFAHYFLLSLHH